MDNIVDAMVEFREKAEKQMISIICPVHNFLEYTKKCLKSLSATIDNSSYKKNISIIFVDDGSTDGTAEWINENYPEITVLKGNGSLWWSGAMNVGAKCALKRGAQYVLAINNDNTFEDDYIEKLIRFAKEKNFKIVGSKIMELTTNKVLSLGGYFNRKTGRYGLYRAAKENKTSYYSVDWLPGMGTLIHRSVFEKIGYWNEKDFPQYDGDSDFILRAKENGVDAYVYLESIMWNDTKTTGMLHDRSFIKLIRSLVSIKSQYNIFVTFKFFIAHKTSFIGMIKKLVNKYGRYIGGFFKHKFIDMFKNTWKRF